MVWYSGRIRKRQGEGSLVQGTRVWVEANVFPGIPMDFCSPNSIGPCTFPLYRILPCTNTLILILNNMPI